jgi:hypothetical protein
MRSPGVNSGSSARSSHRQPGPCGPCHVDRRERSRARRLAFAARRCRLLIPIPVNVVRGCHDDADTATFRHAASRSVPAKSSPTDSGGSLAAPGYASVVEGVLVARSSRPSTRATATTSGHRLSWAGVSGEAVELAVVADDPDARKAGDAEYKGPRPPGDDGAHSYRLVVYVLGEEITADGGVDSGEALDAVGEAAIANGTLTGTVDPELSARFRSAQVRVTRSVTTASTAA